MSTAAEEMQQASKLLMQARKGSRRAGTVYNQLGYALQNATVSGENYSLGQDEPGLRHMWNSRRQTITAITMISDYERTELLAQAVGHMTAAYLEATKGER